MSDIIDSFDDDFMGDPLYSGASRPDSSSFFTDAFNMSFGDMGREAALKELAAKERMMRERRRRDMAAIQQHEEALRQHEMAAREQQQAAERRERERAAAEDGGAAARRAAAIAELQAQWQPPVVPWLRRHHEVAGQVCSYCYRRGEPGGLAACSRCSQYQYCDAVCAAAHWRQEHGRHCQPLVANTVIAQRSTAQRNLSWTVERALAPLVARADQQLATAAPRARGRKAAASATAADEGIEQWWGIWLASRALDWSVVQHMELVALLREYGQWRAGQGGRRVLARVPLRASACLPVAS